MKGPRVSTNHYPGWCRKDEDRDEDVRALDIVAAERVPTPEEGTGLGDGGAPGRYRGGCSGM